MCTVRGGGCRGCLELLGAGRPLLITERRREVAARRRGPGSDPPAKSEGRRVQSQLLPSSPSVAGWLAGGRWRGSSIHTHPGLSEGRWEVRGSSITSRCVRTASGITNSLFHLPFLLPFQCSRYLTSGHHEGLRRLRTGAAR